MALRRIIVSSFTKPSSPSIFTKLVSIENPIRGSEKKEKGHVPKVCLGFGGFGVFIEAVQGVASVMLGSDGKGSSNRGMQACSLVKI
jgi:hypothetical protein